MKGLKQSIKLHQSRIELGCLVAILVLAVFLRFNNLGNIASFEYDAQYNSYLVYNLVHNHHLSLIGQQTSFGGMYLGPWHYLFLTPFYILFNLHPIGGYVGEGVIGLLTIASYYWIGKKMFSGQVGLLSAFFRSIAFTSIFEDLNIGPAFPAELLSIWFIYFLIEFYQGKINRFIILSFLFGMMFTVHLVALPLIFVWLGIILIKRPKIDLKVILLSIPAFLIPVLPFLVFEIRYRFVHMTGFLQTLSHDGRETSDFSYKIKEILGYNLPSFYKIFDEKILPGWLGYLIFGLLVIFLIRKWQLFNKPYHQIIFFLTTGVILLYYIIYPRHTPEYYFLSMKPIIFLYVSALLISIARLKYLWPLVLSFIVISSISCFNQMTMRYQDPNKYTLAQKDAAVKYIVDHQRGKGPYSVSYIMDFGREYGFQYFFTLYGLEPIQDYKQPVYSLVLPRSIVHHEEIVVSYGEIGVVYPKFK